MPWSRGMADCCPRRALYAVRETRRETGQLTRSWAQVIYGGFLRGTTWTCHLSFPSRHCPPNWLTSTRQSGPTRSGSFFDRPNQATKILAKSRPIFLTCISMVYTPYWLAMLIEPCYFSYCKLIQLKMLIII